MKKQSIILLVLLHLFIQVKAQTPQINHKKYWETRDRLKKYFTKIGAGQGESIPIPERNQESHQYGSPYIRCGDGTSQIAFYIGVLATEYKLLKNEGLSTKETLNELYFAIRAFNRLDLTAEDWYARKLEFETRSENLNGWFIRDDIPEDFWQNWQDCGLEYNRSDFYVPGQNPSFNAGNDPSQDQVVLLFNSFALVKKYVDNVYVDPLQNNTGYYLVNEVKSITERIMGRLLEFKRLADNPHDDKDNKKYKPQFYKSNYTFGTPNYNYTGFEGHDDLVFLNAYGLCKMAEEITGNNYEFGFKFQIGGDDVNIIITVPFSKLKDIYYDQIIANDM